MSEGVFVAARLIGAGLHPFDLFELQPNIVHYVTTCIYARGVGKDGIADALPPKLFERLDAAAFLHVERRMPKHSRRKNRNWNQAVVTLREHPGPFSKRHLTYVPFLVSRRAVENLRRR